MTRQTLITLAIEILHHIMDYQQNSMACQTFITLGFRIFHHIINHHEANGISKIDHLRAGILHHIVDYHKNPMAHSTLITPNVELLTHLLFTIITTIPLSTKENLVRSLLSSFFSSLFTVVKLNQQLQRAFFSSYCCQVRSTTTASFGLHSIFALQLELSRYVLNKPTFFHSTS